MTTVYRYTEEAKAQSKCRVPAEPWLHCMIIRMRGANYCIVFVWDTRAIVGYCRTQLSELNAPIANDSHKPLIGSLSAKDLEAVNVAAGFIKPAEQIDKMKAYLRSSRLACLKGMIRIFENQSPDELNGMLKHFNGIGFSRVDVRDMTRWSKMLLKREMPDEQSIRTICNKMPKYAKQLVSIAMQGQRSIDADNVEKFLRSNGVR